MTNLAPAFSLRHDYVLRRLEHRDVPAMFFLQELTRAELGKENAYFIIPKSEERMASFVEPPNLAVGIAIMGELAGMALVGVPNVLELAAGPQSGLVQSVYVHPDHRGQGLMDALLAGIEASAREIGITTLNSRVALENSPSKAGFERNGYMQYGSGRRDLDGTPLALFKKVIEPIAPVHRMSGDMRVLPAVLGR